MSQTGRTRYLARSATRARSARRGEEQKKSRQKGDNFRAIMDRVLIGSSDVTSSSQYLLT